ncbi:DUF3857 domain-containing protein [Flavobacterium longum]|uniref:DUF3857 domain-containing protein n=1 Tax=Flavobacterium longum TaxID=1299340 RepID=UPI0039E94561
MALKLEKGLCLLMCFFVCLAQSQKMELGKVSEAELREKLCPTDTTAPAAVIFKKATSKFRYRKKTGFYIDHEYEFRIKIYKKEGLSWGNFPVPYYTGYKNLDDDYLEFSDAVTYNLESGKIVKTKTGREGQFKKKRNEYWDEATLVLANVKVGSVIEFKYRLRTEDITEFPTFEFQYDIPVKYCTYNTIIPQYFQYKPISCGFGNIATAAKIVDDSQNFEDDHGQSVSIRYQAVSRDFYGEDIPALKDEPYVDNLDNYRAAVKHELEKIQFPDEEPKLYATTWEAVANDIYKNENFGKPLQERQYFEAYLAAFVKPDQTPLQRATAVFEYVQRTMSWNGKYGYLVKKGLKNAFLERTGNVAEINLMLVAMLNYAGVSAHPVLVSTVDNGVAVFPNRAIFNYVIAAAEIDGRTTLFDATDKNSAANILPFRDLNWHGWRIANDGSVKQIDLVPKTSSKAMFTVMAKVDASGTLSGKVKVSKTDYFGYGFRDKFKGTNQDDYLQWLEKELNGIEIWGYTADIPDAANQMIEEKFDFSGSSVEVIGEKIYIDPMLFLTRTKNPFVSDTRVLPIYYGFPTLHKYNISIQIPAGYTVASLPKAVMLTMPENVGTYKMNAQQQTNVIQLTASLEINQAIVSSDFYPVLKRFYDGMAQSASEKIVLIKI